MQIVFTGRLGWLAFALAALTVSPVLAQQVGVGSRVFGPPPTRTIVGGTFTAGGVFAAGYAYRPYYAYGAPWYGGAWYGGGWYGGGWYRPPSFGYGYYGPWGPWRYGPY